MWICTNNAFLSIVDKDCAPNELLVRARRKGDITRVFPGVEVERTPGNDYLYRARVSRDNVGAVIGALAAGIDYPNFKASVRDDQLHTAYNRIWGVMAATQEVPPYSRTARGAR